MITKQRFNELGKKALGSLLLSAAVLSIANIETIYQEKAHQDRQLDEQQAAQAQERLKARLATKDLGLQPSTPLEHLRVALSQDELDNANPYTALNTLEPIRYVLGKGVSRFRRETLRSPQYKEEAGYDVVSYEITHADHSVSKILAYAETPLADPAARQTVVIVLQSHRGVSKQFLFRDGVLEHQGQVTLAQASSLVNQKLNASVPFFSVSR